jgi:hypothetical protein
MEEILMQIRAHEVPAYPREVIALRLDGLTARRTTGNGASRSVRWRPRRILAASALVAVTVAFALWLLVSFESTEALAFGDVQKAVDAAQTMRYRILHYSRDPGYLAQYNVKAGEPTVSQLFYSGNRVRSEQPLGMVWIGDFDKGVSMFISHHQRRAEMDPIVGKELLKRSLDFRARLRNMAESGATRLPDRQLNGRNVSEFVMQIDDQDFTVTVDPRTKLPIRMEVVRTKQPEKGQRDIREVYTDFVFDAPIDESLFRIQGPAGYKLVNRVPRNSRPNPRESIALVVSPDEGIGPVKFGAKVADIVRLLGEPDWRDDGEYPGPVPSPGAESWSKAVNQTRTEFGYDRRGFRLMADEQRGMFSIHCFNRHGGVSTTEHGFGGKTKEGISLGASLEEVLKTYGKPDALMDSRLVWYRKRGYEFQFYDKKLASIQVRPANPNLETEIEVRGDQIIERLKAAK